MAALLLIGTLAALWVLAGRVGAGRKVRGVVESTSHYPELRVLETTIQLQPGWPGHKAGQFALSPRSRARAAPHTIASAWNPDSRRIVFLPPRHSAITAELPTLLRDRVTGDGGRPVMAALILKTYARGKSGWRRIGITPFISRMQQLAQAGGPPPQIDLFPPHCRLFAGRHRQTHRRCRRRAHPPAHSGQRQDGRLDGEHIRARVPDWATPASGSAARRHLARHCAAILRHMVCQPSGFIRSCLKCADSQAKVRQQ